MMNLINFLQPRKLLFVAAAGVIGVVFYPRVFDSPRQDVNVRIGHRLNPPKQNAEINRPVTRRDVAPPVEKKGDAEYDRIQELIKQFKNENVMVLVNGREYPLKVMLLTASAYLKRNYRRGVSAEEWIRDNCYRTDEGNIIYFKYTDGQFRPMRDVFLEALTRQKSAILTS